MQFFNRSNGEYWINKENWNNNNINYCYWYGIFCYDTISYQIIGFDLSNNNVTYQEDPKINEISTLEFLKFDGNNIKFLPNITGLNNLQIISFSNNSISFIPSNYGNTSNINFFNIKIHDIFS